MGRALLALALISAVLTGCERTLTADPPPDDATGTFEARVRPLTGNGFETMEGSASFETTFDGAPTFTVRLASPLPNGADTTTFDLVMASSMPAPGEYGVGDPAETGPTAVVGCYRSVFFPDGPYRSESGTLTVTASSADQVEGAFDVTVYLLLQTGPTTSQRVRLRIDGTFSAAAGDTNTDAEAVRRCEPSPLLPASGPRGGRR